MNHKMLSARSARYRFLGALQRFEGGRMGAPRSGASAVAAIRPPVNREAETLAWILRESPAVAFQVTAVSF